MQLYIIKLPRVDKLTKLYVRFIKEAGRVRALGKGGGEVLASGAGEADGVEAYSGCSFGLQVF